MGYVARRLAAARLRPLPCVFRGIDSLRLQFPITALREINALMVCKHENVVGIREVVVGDTLTQCVFSLRDASRKFITL